jgi:hypothetical protein
MHQRKRDPFEDIKNEDVKRGDQVRSRSGYRKYTHKYNRSSYRKTEKNGKDSVIR